MRTVVIGQGAIGSLLTAKCQQQGLPIAAITRANADTPSMLRWQNNSCIALEPQPILPSDIAKDDLIILPLKAYHFDDAIKQIGPYIDRQPLLLLHNGMGVAERIQSMVPTAAIAVGVTRVAALKQADGVIETGTGQTDLSWFRPPDSGAIVSIEQHLSQLLSPCVWHADLSSAQWQKLAINAVINPLTAIHNCRNGELAQQEYAEQKANLLAETMAVMTKLNIKGNQQLPQQVEQVIAATAQNYSSMHQDIAAGRKTEIDAINGHIVQQAISLDLPCPVNRQVWSEVKVLENQGR